MKRFFTFTICLILGFFTVQAAYFQNVPRTLVQPNGDTLHCFVTGDEFYHYLHDADGYTIVKNPETGYFVYASRKDGRVVPTEFVAGKVLPQAVGLTPHITISASEWQQRRDQKLAPVRAAEASFPHSRDDEANHGHMNNLVIFIHFYGDQDFSQAYSEVADMFNDSTSENANSMYNYFKKASYNQLFITSHLYPLGSNDNILYYADPHPRLYYEPLSASNPIGYDPETDEQTEREMVLLRNAIEYVADMIPEDLNLDYNGDDLVDNICFVVRGDVGDWGELLWPHRWCLFYFDDYVTIHDKVVWDFNFELSDNNWYFSNSTLCHEMSHTLGMPDLYHYEDTLDLNPIGSWDLMAQNAAVPQQSGAFIKHKYGNWIPEITEITESGRYTVRVMTSPTNERLAYKIQSEMDNEFFVFEARKKTDYFDQGIYDSGLLIYRINENFEGNAAWDGQNWLDEVYVYRPGGTISSSGHIEDAAFRQGNHRTQFDYSTDPRPFLSNGYVSTLRICDIHSYLDSVSFYYLAPGDTLPAADTVGIDFLTYGTLQVYPNPAAEQVYINLPVHVQSADIVQASVFDLQGRKVEELPCQSICKFSVNNYESGFYIIKIQLRDGYTYVQKVQVIH